MGETMKPVRSVDLFCGAGGTSTGLMQACQQVGLRADLLAINHWEIAIETHSHNHPDQRHLCENLDNVDPRKVVRGELDLLIASPECTHHSCARGGRPVNDQSRASAWHVVRWATELRPKWILVENVREFQTWGPLCLRTGRPLKSKRGETFQAWLQALRSLNYTVEYRLLNAADYGDPTTRVRLFILARRGRHRSLPWPEPTHRPPGIQQDLFGPTRTWRTAREIIDWTLAGESIFRRKRPLASTTLRRIEAGLRRFGGRAAEPFLVVLRNHMHSRPLDRPVPTIAANGTHIGLCEPFLLPHRVFEKGHVDSIDRPLRTFTATNGGGHLVEPFLIKYYSNGHPCSLDQPLDTLTTRDRYALVEPAWIDIRFRMLQPHELAAAMGFPDGYWFAGNKSDQVRQIGNAVAVNTATALCKSILRA